MTKEELLKYKESLEEMRGFHEAFIPNVKLGIRNLYKIAEVVYPLIDDFVNEHIPTHREGRGKNMLEFCIKVPDFFSNAYDIWEEWEEKFHPDYGFDFNNMLWTQCETELEYTMDFTADEVKEQLGKDIWGDREFTVAGSSGGWLLVEHRFNYYPEVYSILGSRWDQTERKNKLWYLAQYATFTSSLPQLSDIIKDVEELLMWYIFEEELSKTISSMESEEYAKDMYEFMKEDYVDWLASKVEEYQTILKSLEVEE